jgi:hypothetical protein
VAKRLAGSGDDLLVNAFDKYQNDLLSAVSNALIPALKESRDAGVALWNKLLDTGGPATVKQKPTSSERFLGELLTSFNEIACSYETLQDIEIYISSFPFNRSRTTPLRFLRFLIGAYLNEMYILRERLLTHLKRLKKLYSKDTRLRKILLLVNRIDKVVLKQFEDISLLRGSHVHILRYSDKDIERLGILELLSAGFSHPTFSDLFRFDYRATRSKWKKTIKSNNAKVKKLFDLYFEGIQPIVFDNTGKPIYP